MCLVDGYQPPRASPHFCCLPVSPIEPGSIPVLPPRELAESPGRSAAVAALLVHTRWPRQQLLVAADGLPYQAAEALEISCGPAAAPGETAFAHVWFHLPASACRATHKSPAHRQ